MGGALSFTVPGAPVGKGRPRFSRKNGIAYTPAKTRSYEAEIKHFAVMAMGARPLIDGPVAVVVTAHLPIPRSWSKKRQREAVEGERHPCGRPDVDNFAKTAFDAMNGIVFRDDSQVVHLLVFKRYAEKPRLEIVVSAAG